MKICKRPCNQCPFNKETEKGWLGAGRIGEIVRNFILGGMQSFPCHKTYNKDVAKQSICAGALLMEKRYARYANASSRLLIDLGILAKDYSGIEGENLLHNSIRELCEHHRNYTDDGCDYSEWYAEIEGDSQ